MATPAIPCPRRASGACPINEEQHLRARDAELSEEEGKRQVEVNRAQQADRILKDPLIADAFQAVEVFLMKQWRRAKNIEAREEAHREVKALDAVRRKFEKEVETGKLAKKQLDEIDSKRGDIKDRLRGFLRVA